MTRLKALLSIDIGGRGDQVEVFESNISHSEVTVPPSKPPATKIALTDRSKINKNLKSKLPEIHKVLFAKFYLVDNGDSKVAPSGVEAA